MKCRYEIYQSCQWHSWLLLKQKLGRPLPLCKAILFQIIKQHLFYVTWLFRKGEILFNSYDLTGALISGNPRGKQWMTCWISSEWSKFRWFHFCQHGAFDVIDADHNVHICMMTSSTGKTALIMLILLTCRNRFQSWHLTSKWRTIET